MSEQATRVQDDRSGDYVATRDAYEQDGESKDRVIQIVDLAYRQLTLNEIRGADAPITSADGVDLDSLPSELTANLITVGDKRTLIVEALHDANDGEVLITPIAVNESQETAITEFQLAGGYDTGHKTGYYNGVDYTWGSSILQLYFGWTSSSTSYRTLALFPITLPVDVSEIKRAYLKMVDHENDNADNPTNGRIMLIDQDDVSGFPTSPLPLWSGYPVKPPVNWDSRYYADGVTPFILDNGVGEIADITTQFKEVVGRAGFVDGNNLGIIMFSASYLGVGEVRPRAYYYDGYSEGARLAIEYDTLDTENLSILPTKSTAMGTAKFVDNYGKYVSPMLAWEIYGAKKIGLHITQIGGTGNGVKVRAGVI